jgi:hypothetical protein
MEYEEQADRMDEDADKLEQHSDQLGERIDEVESDWERKEQDASVPGAQPDPDEDEEPAPEDAAGEHGTENPGVPGEEETATGNPDAAGADE